MNITDFKAANPDYKDVPDLALADALHAKYYSDIPLDQFRQQVGMSAPAQASFSDAMPRDAYQKQFLANNPQADQNALDMALAGYDKDAALRAQAATAAPADRFKTLQSPEATFNAKLNAKLQGLRNGVVPQLPAKMQPDQIVNPAPTPTALQTVGANAVGGLMGGLAGAGAAAASLVGADDTAAGLDAARKAIEQKQHEEFGGDTILGRASSLVGGIAPVLAVPAEAVPQLIANAGLFANPAFRDTYKAKIAQGQSENLAMAHAAEAFGLNLFAPTVAAHGMGALAGKLGTAGLDGLGGAAAQVGQAAVEGAGFSVANSVMDKGTDLIAGQQNNNGWIDPKDMAAQALGFGALRAGHGIASGISARVGAEPPVIAPAAPVDNIAQAQSVDQAIAAATAAVPSINVEALRSGNDTSVADLMRSIRPLEQPVALSPAEPVAAPAVPTSGTGTPSDLGQRYVRVTNPDGSTGFVLDPTAPTGETDVRSTSPELQPVGELGRGAGDIGASLPEPVAATGLAGPDGGLQPDHSAGLPTAAGTDIHGADRSADSQPALAAEAKPLSKLELSRQNIARQEAVVQRAIENNAQRKAGKLVSNQTGDPMLDNPESWVIRNKTTGEVIGETFDRAKVDALNTDKYEAVPVAQHLREVNDHMSLAGRLARGETTKSAQMPEDQPVRAADAGTPIDSDWHAFPPNAGGKDIQRSDMPQIAAEHRGALTQFLAARGISHEPAAGYAPEDLKPTQREFSPAKVDAAHAYQGGDRSILISSDNHVLDGHHQWLAKLENGEPVQAIKLNAPIAGLIDHVREFPSATTADGAAREVPPELAKGAEILSSQKFQPAHGDLRVVDPAMLTGAERTITPEHAQFVQELGKALGKNVHFFTQEGGTRRIDGLAPSAHPNDLFVNVAKGDAAWHVVAGHEFFHQMPEHIRAPFIEAIRPLIKPGEFGALKKYVNQPNLSDAGHWEEVAADLFGNRFAEPEFLTKALSRLPDRSMVARVAAYLRDFIGKLTSLPGKQFASDKYVADLDRVRAAAHEALGRYLANEPAPVSAQGKRDQAIADLAGKPSSELRTIADSHPRTYLRDAAASELQDRAEATASKRSEAMKVRMQRDTRIDPERDHMMQALAKLGGINRDSAQGRMRLTPEELNVKANVGNLARNVFVKNGGMRIEDAGAAMADLGYVDHDHHGKHDQTDWEDKLSRAANGESVYTPQAIMARAEAMHAHEMEQVGASSEAEFSRIEHYADMLEDWAGENDIDLSHQGALYPDAKLMDEGDIHENLRQEPEAGDRQETGDGADGPAREGAQDAGTAPAFGGENQGTRQRLKAIASNLDIPVREVNGGYRAGGGEIEIPSEDAHVQGGTAEKVFAHELGHAVMQKRGVSFRGFPKREIERYITNYDELIRASKEFRPDVHGDKSTRVRAHALKPDEVIADSIASVLMGDKPIELLKPLMDKLGWTARDLGLHDDFKLDSQSRADLVAKDARASDRAVADREQADRERDAFALTAPEGSVTGEAKAMANSRQESLLSDERSQSLHDFRDHLAERYPDAKIDLYPSGDRLNLSRIVLPKDARNEGTGSAIMREITDFADANGKTVTLSPSGDFGGSKARLVEFYKRFGFVENKGKTRDFEISESMYREPRSKLSTEREDDRYFVRLTLPTGHTMIEPVHAQDEATALRRARSAHNYADKAEIVPRDEVEQRYPYLLDDRRAEPRYSKDREPEVRYSDERVEDADQSRLAKLIAWPKEALRSAAFHPRMMVVPMDAGSEVARSMAKDFANNNRRAQAQWQAFDKVLVKRYTDEQLEAMWNAADQENNLRRDGKTSTTEGLASLPQDQREVVELLHTYGENLWAKAKAAGMVEGDGVAFWTPRVAARIYADGSADNLKSAAGEFSKEARNLRTSASSAKHRQYDTTEESEAALKEKFGDDAGYVKNIRVMPMAMAQLERAIAGRTLINQIKAHGQVVGEELVGEDHRPNFVTFDHPAMRRFMPKMDWKPADMEKVKVRGYDVRPDGVYTADGDRLASYRVTDGVPEQMQPVLDETGKPVMESRPLFVRKDFAGPLKAVFSTEPNKVYQGAMAIKGGVTSMIMISPLTHNLVIWGKALPSMVSTMGWKNNLKNLGTLGFRSYFVGNEARNNHALMNELIESGLVPVSGRGMNPDIPAIANGIEPGRSLTAKALGAAFDVLSPKAGENARKTVDAMGQFWHEKLLWDRVADMQAGMAVMMRSHLMDEGIDQYTASRIASHFANRYAGMIPREAMSEGAHILLNLSLFSKSFTMTNLGAYKDLFGGLPKDVQAQIRLRAFEVQKALGKSDGEAEAGSQKTLSAAQKTTRAKAASILVLDIAAMATANSVAQALWQGQSGQQIRDDFKDRLAKLGVKFKGDPLSVIGHPLDSLSSLSQTSDNPHGKEDRVRVGEDEKGNSYYMRLPVGKVGEELKAYSTLSGGLHLLHNKLSTFARPIADMMVNEDFTGKRIINPHDNAVQQVAKFAAYWVKSQLPVEDVAALYHVTKGDGDLMDKAKLLGTATGLSVNKLSGGDVVSEMRYQNREQQAAIRDVLPDAREAVRRGDDDKARQLLEDAGQTPQEANRTLRSIDNPGRVSKQSLRQFNKHASEDDRDRMAKIMER